ncbi:hypothetical protein LTS17_002965 [Exophiala oligosperma]
MRRNAKDKDSPDESSQTPSAPAETTVEFTFVNHTEDVNSIKRRKSGSKQQLSAIRSHVMARVRRLESAQGKHRAKPHQSRASSISTESSVSIKDESHVSAPGSHETVRPSNRLTVVWSATSAPTTPLTVSPANHEYDPFCTLPCNNLPHKSSEGLLSYCFDVLLPTTFSVEFKQPKERLARQGMVLQSKMNNPATYLGFMATVAAHRAVLYGRHEDLRPSDRDHDELINDPDYRKVKHEAIVAVRTLVQKSKAPSQYLVDSCFGLVSIATVVGNFEEAQMHLKGIAHIISLVGCSEESMMWLPVANVKVSVGLLQRPILPIPWERAVIPEEILERISPPAKSVLARMGSAFKQLKPLSSSLQALLGTSRDICNLVEYSSTNPKGLSTSENSLLRHKAIELEYDLVSYPYDIPDFFVHGDTEPFVPPLERVIRMAALGFMSFAPHTIMPSTGLGRAMTCHQMDAIESWLLLRSRKNPGVGEKMMTMTPPATTITTIVELQAVTWALFVFAQCAMGQPEEDFFVNLIVRMTEDLRSLIWLDVERLLATFLYMPRSQARAWADIWTQVKKKTRSQ